MTSALTTLSFGERPGGDARARHVLAIAIGLSLALHGAAVWEWWPALRPIAPDASVAPERASLTALLVPERREREASPAAQPPPSTVTQRPGALPPPKPRPPVPTVDRPFPLPRMTIPRDVSPAPALAPLPDPPLLPQTPTQITPPVASAYPDLSSYIAARRRARGESESGESSPADAELARRNQIVASNLASINTPTLRTETRNTGGMFQITQLNAESAEFTFFGWNKDIQRRASQRIDVRRGPHPDIRLAVVRRMIGIIREYEQEDFTWRSNRLGRDVTLSARAGDNEGLEQFMLREFFELNRIPG